MPTADIPAELWEYERHRVQLRELKMLSGQAVTHPPRRAVELWPAATPAEEAAFRAACGGGFTPAHEDPAGGEGPFR